MQQLVATPAITLEADYVFQEETAHSTDRESYLIEILKSSLGFRNHQADKSERGRKNNWRCGSLFHTRRRGRSEYHDCRQR